METINFTLQVSCISLLAVAGILLIKFARKGLNSWTGVGLIGSVICYLVLDTSTVQENTLLFLIAVTASASIPVIFYLLTRAIFDDSFKASWQIVLWFGLIIASHFWIYLRNGASIGEGAMQFCYIIAEIVSIGFVLGGLYTAIRTRHNDLVESRLRFRNIFISVTAALIGITLIVEAMPIVKQSAEFLQVIQRVSILILTVLFLVSTFEIRSGFFFKEVPREKAPIVLDSQLRMRLEATMQEKKVYRNEGLTIGQLAEMLGEQEYKLRRLINGEMGFRNFNDFLNKYRVKEACEILGDEFQNRKTILEIAYSLGYQSIGPFNKAFREHKQMTPSAFRKAAKA